MTDSPSDTPPVREKTCASCVHWDCIDPEGDDGSGFCRRYPPTVRPEDLTRDPRDDVDYDFPYTCRLEWCGEWAAKGGDNGQ